MGRGSMITLIEGHAILIKGKHGKATIMHKKLGDFWLKIENFCNFPSKIQIFPNFQPKIFRKVSLYKQVYIRNMRFFDKNYNRKIQKIDL